MHGRSHDFTLGQTTVTVEGMAYNMVSPSLDTYSGNTWIIYTKPQVVRGHSILCPHSKNGGIMSPHSPPRVAPMHDWNAVPMLESYQARCWVLSKCCYIHLPACLDIQRDVKWIDTTALRKRPRYLRNKLNGTRMSCTLACPALDIRGFQLHWQRRYVVADEQLRTTVE